MQVGQRLVYTYVIVLVVVFIGLRFGAPIENAQDIFFSLLSPLAIILYGAIVQRKSINSEVEQGLIEPGNLQDLLFRRTTVMAFVISGVWLLQRFGAWNIVFGEGADSQIVIDGFVNFIMLLTTGAISNYSERSSGAEPEPETIEISGIIDNTKAEPDPL